MGYGQGFAQVGHFHVGVAVHQLADFDRDTHAVVIAAPDGFGEEVVAGFLEPRQRAELMHAAFHVAVAGLPVIGLDAIGLQFRVGGKKPGGFHIRHEGRVRIDF